MTLLLSVTLAYAAGLLAGFRQPVPDWCMALLCGAAAVVLCTRPRAAAVAAFIGVGVAIGSVRATAAGRDCREQLTDGAAVVLSGYPLVVPTEGVALAMHVHVLESDGMRCGELAIRVRAMPRHNAVFEAAVNENTSVSVRGRWMSYSRRNDWPRNAQHAGGVLVDAVAPDSAVAGGDAVTRFRIAQQRRLRAMLPQTWGLAESLLLAESAGITPAVRMRWVSSGLVHLLAISGMHVGMIAAGAMLVCAWLRVAPRTGRRVALLASTAYVLFLGAPAAALRSLLQAALLLGSIELQRPAEPFTALAAAALGILLIEPLAILDVGFQLSFAGMIGLVGWRRAAMDSLPTSLHPWIRDGLASGIAATALTTPVAALHFGTASWIGIPATVIAAPLFAAALALLVIGLVIASLTGAVAGPHAWATEATLRILDTIAATAAAVPGGHGYLAWTTVILALLAAAAFVVVRAHRREDDSAAPPVYAPAAVHRRFAHRDRYRRLTTAVAVAAALALVAWGPLVLRPHDGAVEIHAIDVGQGDAFAVRTPAGRWLLVDAGPRTARTDAGRDRVVPYLLRRGARRIEAMVLTHPDADHIGGAAAVLDVFDVGVVIDPGLAAGKDIFIDLLAAARQSGQRWIAGRAGVSFSVDGVEITLLYPVTDLDAARNANDTSVVFRLTYGSFAALFLGDAPMSVEEQLVALHGDRLDVALIKVGHHGSATSTGDALLQATQPRVALVPVGRRNRYGHPNPRVLHRLEQYDVRVLRTDESGSFVVRAMRDGTMHVFAN